MFRWVAVAIALCGSLIVTAQPVVPSSVRSVVSAGHWEENGRDGIYRVVVTTEGWEHLWSRLFIEWVSIPPSREGDYTVVAVVEPKLPFSDGTTILEAKVRAISASCMEVIVSGTENTLKRKRTQVVLVAAKPGVILPMSAKHCK